VGASGRSEGGILRKIMKVGVSLYLYRWLVRAMVKGLKSGPKKPKMYLYGPRSQSGKGHLW